MLEKTTLYLIGDSTVADYPENRRPQAGWGQMLREHFSDDILISNHAVNGTSTKSFIEENYFEPVSRSIKNGDFLFIQFGHNDQKDDYRKTEPYTTYTGYLNFFIDTALEKGATPVLITSVVRRVFEGANLINTLCEYPNAVRRLAKERGIPLIDLNDKTKALYLKTGQAETKKFHLFFDKGACKNYPDALEDNTHYSEYGASVIAELVVDGIREAKLTLSQYLKV